MQLTTSLDGEPHAHEAASSCTATVIEEVDGVGTFCAALAVEPAGPVPVIATIGMPDLQYRMRKLTGGDAESGSIALEARIGESSPWTILSEMTDDAVQALLT